MTQPDIERVAPRRVSLGLPWPWRFHKIAIFGDRCFWWAHSPRTFAVGLEILRDGSVFFLGPLHFGWASLAGAAQRISSAEAERDEAREALAPFNISIRPELPDDALIDSIAFTAADFRRVAAVLAIEEPD